MSELIFYCTNAKRNQSNQGAAFTCTKFANGELSITIDQSVRRKKCTIVQQINPISLNDDLFEVMLLADAMKGASAQSIRLIIPYLPVNRGANLLAKMLQRAGIDEIVTVSSQTISKSMFDIPFTNINPNEQLAEVSREAFLI